jgi:hypothetical protein
MSKKLITACMALAAFVAFAVAPAIASAKPVLTQPTGTPLATGSEITGTNVGNTLMTTGLGTVTCEKAELKGTLTKNNSTEGVEGEIEGASFTECTSWTGSVTVTANPETNGLPWCVKAIQNGDTITIGGGTCAKPRALRFVLHFGGFIGTCTYQRTEAASGTISTHGAETNPNTATITKQTWNKLEGGGGCPSSGALDMTFSLENKNGAINIQ